ncbi:MAG: hypothetical protein EBU54_01885 [Mycobacteriaceae bacterium]|nr:hypothetical protein [Mycobacteriaceae bacterium]
MCAPGSPGVRRCCPASSSSPRRSPRSSRDDTGSATVLAAILITALLSMTAGALMLGAAVVARHRAQAAADLAALAGAGRLPGTPCRRVSGRRRRVPPRSVGAASPARRRSPHRVRSG